MSDVVMCLGGGRWQLDLIRTVRARGYLALVADRSPQCPGRAEADIYSEVDTNDVGALLVLARRHRVCLVLAEQTDRVVPVAAALNEQLDLPGLRPEVALRFTDKLIMRRSLEGSGIPMPAYEDVARVDEALAFGKREGYPLVLKPKRAQSSLGVFKVDNPLRLKDAFVRTMAWSLNGSILVERFMEGIEITVEGLCLHGCPQVLAISEKEHFDFNPCVARRLAYPPRFPAPLLARIGEVADVVVRVLGLRDGLTHAEYRIVDGEPYLIEVAARGGGTRIAPLIVPWVSGVDVYGLWLDSLEGKTVQLPKPLQRAAALEFFSFQPGRVKAVHGLEAASAFAADIGLAFAHGDTLKRPEDDTSRLGHFIVLGETRDDVDQGCARVRELVTVEYQ